MWIYWPALSASLSRSPLLGPWPEVPTPTLYSSRYSDYTNIYGEEIYWVSIRGPPGVSRKRSVRSYSLLCLIEQVPDDYAERDRRNETSLLRPFGTHRTLVPHRSGYPRSPGGRSEQRYVYLHIIKIIIDVVRMLPVHLWTE